MSYTAQLLQQSEARYGAPLQIRLNYTTPKEHFDFIRSTQKDGRAHDITLYLYHHRRLAVTRKPMYPPGAFRPPSGGLKPGESLEEGVEREGWEELGIRVVPVRYLLRVRLDFVCGDDRIPWTTHVFSVRASKSSPPVLNPQDTREIAQAVWAQEEEFFGPMRRGLIAMGSTGLLYRAHLHDFVRRKFGWGDKPSGAPPAACDALSVSPQRKARARRLGVVQRSGIHTVLRGSDAGTSSSPAGVGSKHDALG